MRKLTQKCSLIFKFSLNTVQLKRVIIDSPDTFDAVISLYHHVTNLVLLDSIWFKAGTGNEQQLIPIHSLTSEYGLQISCLLLAINAISGCDSVSSFSRIGKRKHSRHLKRKLISWRICVTLVSSHHSLCNALPWMPLFSLFALFTRRTIQLQISMNCNMKYL